jgi:uncharacterized protein (TIGR04222 family)
MVPAGDTWGISGPQFLFVYVVLAVVVTVAQVRMRRALADVPAGHPVGRPDERPYDVAYLNGGAELALCAALSAMHRSETIAIASRGTVVAAARPDPRADELERANHDAAVVLVHRRQLAAAGAVASALHRIESRLVDAGLLLTPERRTAGRATRAAAVAAEVGAVAAAVATDRRPDPTGVIRAGEHRRAATAMGGRCAAGSVSDGVPRSPAWSAASRDCGSATSRSR